MIRAVGGVVGAGASFVLAAILMTAMLSSYRPGSEPLGGVLVAFATAGAGMLLPAAIGGALVAPWAWRARNLLAWVGAIALLAVVAVLLGAVSIALIFVAGMVGQSGPLVAIGPALSAAIVIVLLGVVFVGPFVLPFTAAGAAIWAVGMWLVRGAMSRRPMAGDPGVC